MHVSKVFKIQSLVLLAVVTVFAQPTLAQDDDVLLDEITVTAQRRAVNLQDASLAISVISGESFSRSNVVRIDNFNGYVPGLVVSKNDGAGRVLALRGVGWETAQNLSTQPGVLIYINGIYVANPIASGQDLGDIERIDVYRGPQGTEFGQGAIGGAVNIITRKPDFDGVSGYAEVGYGTFNTIRANAAINIPLSEVLAIRASFQKYNRDGFAEIEGGELDGYDLDDADSYTGKIALRWRPNENFTLDLLGFIQDSDQHAAAQRNVLDPNPNRRRLSQDFPGIFALENKSISAVMEWTTSGGVSIKSLTGYQELKKRQSVDGDRLTEALVSIDTLGFGGYKNWDVLTFWDNDSDAFTQELSVSNHSEKLDWVFGVYYLHHENSNYFLEANGPSPFSDSIDVLADPSIDTLPPFGASVLDYIEDRTLVRDDSAVFGQFTYRLDEKFAFTGGVRWQNEDQEDHAVQFFTSESSSSASADAVTWKVGLDFHAADDNLIYALVSKGWKNGGFNPGAAGSVNIPTDFKPEEVTSYEIGSKNVFWNGSFRFNVVGYYLDYKNLQFMMEDATPFGSGANNIPNTEVYGIETEFNWILNNEWRLDGQVTWSDGEFKDDFFTLDVVDWREELAPGVGLFTQEGYDIRLDLAQTTNVKGNKIPKLVDLTANLALTNTHTFGSQSVLISRLEYIHRGEFQYRIFNNPLSDTVKPYDILNLFFAYERNGSPFSFSLTATNILDTDGVNSRFSNPFSLMTTSEEFIPPREVIASVRYSF